MPAPLRTRRSVKSTSRQRAPTTQSIPDSVSSSASAASTTHVMTVTQEEMALLEMMRRKRAEMQGENSSPQAFREDSGLCLTSALNRDFERQNSTAKSVASSTISRDSDKSILGTAFPAPPSGASSGRVASTPTERNFSGTSADENVLAHVLTHVLEEDDANSEKEAQESQGSPIYHELEAPLETLCAVTYSQPRTQWLPRAHVDKNSGLPVPYNAADPYSLAPDLNFSPLDLLPPPTRPYSPSLSTSRSSWVGSQSSTLTPTTDGNNGGVGVVGSTTSLTDGGICELDVKRNSRVTSMNGAGNDVLAAWGALGGA